MRRSSEPASKPPVERPVVPEIIRPDRGREVGLRSLRDATDEDDEQAGGPSRGGEVVDPPLWKEPRVKWVWPDLDSLDDDEEEPWFQD